MVLNLLKRYDAKFANVACRQTVPQSQTLFSVTLTADSLICSWAIHISSFATQLRAGGFEGADLLPWAQLHAGPVTGLSVQHDTGELATCGLDGRVFLLPATVNCCLSVMDAGSFTFRPGGNPARLVAHPARPSNRRRSFCLAHSAHLPRDSSLDRAHVPVRRRRRALRRRNRLLTAGGRPPSGRSPGRRRRPW